MKVTLSFTAFNLTSSMYLQLMTLEVNEISIKKTAESDQIYKIVKLSMFTMKQTFHPIKFERK